MTRNRLSTSSWARTAEGSSITIRRASWESARAMLTICLPGGRTACRPRGSRRSRSAQGAPAARAQPRLHRRAAEKPRRRTSRAQKDVLGDAQAVDEVELLIDRGDAAAHGGHRRRQGDLFALPPDHAVIGLMRAGEHLDQGGLPGAVLSEEAVHLARQDLQIHTVKRPDSWELLDDARHRQQRRPGRCRDRLGHEPSETLKTESEIIRAAPTTPASAPISESTIGRLPVASGRERR